MSEGDWLTCTDLIRMLCVLRGDCSRRKVRLFAAGYCRQVWHLLANEQCHNAVEISESFADGLATSMELEAAVEAVWQTMPPASRFDFDWDEYAGHLTAVHASELTLTRFAHGASYARVLASQPGSEASQCNLLRDIFGNPFRPVAQDSTWLMPKVVNLAHAIYDDHNFDRLPILADALEEAGCQDAAMLDHCRQPGPHARGCWVVDLLLGK